MSPGMPGPLDGIRVLDLTRVLAGPYCTMFLGDLGAEVVKVEEPGRGDDTRGWGPPFLGSESAYFLCINRNKKGVALNLKSPHGIDLVRRLAMKADVVVENFRPGTMELLGLAAEKLRAENPRLIYVSLSGYGSDGSVRTAAPPLQLSSTPASIRLPPPLLGQHTEEALRTWLQLDEGDMSKLKHQQII